MSNGSLHARTATPADIPFLAWCNYESASPAPGFCYWDPLLEGLNTSTMDFLHAVFTAEALAWGSVSDFVIMEAERQTLAGASGFMMDPTDFRPFRLDRLPAVADRLGWNAATLEQFQDRYTAVWSDPRDSTLAPSAPWTIECVAVRLEVRGRGIAKQLMYAVLERGKQLGHEAAGIAVTLGNAPAQRVYEAVGFEHYLTYGPAYFNGAFPGTIKYRKLLA